MAGQDFEVPLSLVREALTKSFQGSSRGFLLLTMRIFFPFTLMCESSSILKKIGSQVGVQHGIADHTTSARGLLEEQSMLDANACCGKPDLNLGSLLDIGVKLSEGGVVLQQVRCLLDTTCAKYFPLG